MPANKEFKKPRSAQSGAKSINIITAAKALIVVGKVVRIGSGRVCALTH